MKTFTTSLGILLTAAFFTGGCAKLNPKFEDSLSSALTAKTGEFEGCYKKALKKNSEVEGDMELKLEFAPKSNKPEKTSITASQINDGAMKKCVAAAAKAVETVELPGTWVDGKYTLEFQSK